jgi:hypothetical protein
MANDIKIIVQYETATKAKKEIKDLGNVTLRLDQTQKKNSSTSAKLANQTQKLSKATKVQSSANHQLANSYKAVGGAAMVGGKKMNTFNMRIQQGGYQLQDFVVQMQSGTSFFTAFSQQGSQFAGIFGPAGAVLGAVIAIGSVIGALAFKAYQGSKDIRTMQESVEDLASASSDIKSAVDDINSINANGNLTSASEAMLSMAESSKSIAEAQMSSAMLSFTNQAKISAGIFENILDSAMASSSYIYNLLNPFTALPDFDIGDFTGESSIQKNFEDLGIQAGYGLYESVVKSLKESMATGEAEEQLKSLQRYINVLTVSDGKTTEPKTEKGKEALKNALALSAVLVNQIKAEQKVVDFKNEQLQLVANSARLRDKELEFGKDSVEYQREVNRQAVLRYETSLKLGGLDDRQVAFFVKQRKRDLEAEISLRKEIKLKKDKLKQDKLDDKERARLEKSKQDDEDRLNALKGRNLANFLRGKYKAERLAKEKTIQDELDLNAQRGKNLAVLLRARYRRIRLAKEAEEKAEEELRKLRSNNLADFLRLKYRNIRLAKEAEKKAEEELQELRKKNMDALYESRGSRVGPAPAKSPFSLGMAGAFSTSEAKIESDEEANKQAEALQEYIDNLIHQKNVETELVGIFDSERDIKQKILNIQHEYDGIITPSQIKQIENTLKLTDAETKRHEALEKAKQEQEALGASIEASMEKAFMSMVDGTASVKDAFKTMAREIIAELYKVLVVKKMVAAISAGFADGGVFSGGSQVQAYADGGVVGSPTTFPMTGGRTGLMGEAGPEAIMPLKRGANGKLGVQMEGGATTTVVQNFNFSANGDDSVKRIIAQAAPKIAQMTKSEIINDRRRGGTMKATFG